MSDPNNRKAYDAGYNAWLNGESYLGFTAWGAKGSHWERGYETAAADQERNKLQTEGDMPEEQIKWLRQNLKLEIERSSGLARVHLCLGDEVISSIDIDLQEPSI